MGVEIRRGNYDSRHQFDAALQSISALLLVSGMAKPEGRIQQHRNVIEAAKSNGVGRIVYTSIIGAEEDTAFSPVVQSNRQTERDVQSAGLEWVIGRNGIYIEPDLEYIDTYVREGGIRNCAGEGKCAYTSRPELAAAYAKTLLEERHAGQVYNLAGEAITQARPAEVINDVYGTDLTYTPVSVEAYAADRTAALGEFTGTIIAGIYEGIQRGTNDVLSDFAAAACRPHQAVLEIVRALRASAGLSERSAEGE